PGEDARVASQPGQPCAEPTAARCGPAIEGMIAVAGAPSSETASARRARVARPRQLPDHSAEAAPGAAAPLLAREPKLAAAGGGGIGTALGLTDPADTGGDGGAVEIGGAPAPPPPPLGGPRPSPQKTRPPAAAARGRRPRPPPPRRPPPPPPPP